MFRLAERLGMTVAELGQRMSAPELMEWLALDQMDATVAEEQAKRQDLAGQAAGGAVAMKTKLQGA